MKKIFGHRGLPQIYKENTFTGINKANEYCDFVEIDIRLTKDNNLILFHDPNIGDDLIKDLTLAELEILLNGELLKDCILVSRDQLKGKINFVKNIRKDEKIRKYITASLELNFLPCSNSSSSLMPSSYTKEKLILK